MSEDFDKYLAIANHYIQMVKNMGELELKSYVASILYDNDKKVDMIHELEEENKRLNNIINTMLDFNFFKEECPLNFGYTEKCDEEKAQDVFYEDDYCEKTCNDDYKKCWLKYFERLQELKGSDSDE